MSTTSGVITSIGARVDKREMLGDMALLCTERSHPDCITTSIRGYKMGLHDRVWAAHIARQSGTATYYVRVVPIFSGMVDPDGLPLMGTPTTINTSKGTTFSFDPFPDGYSCDGYRIYADDGAGTTLYYQGTLSGRFSTTFIVNSTWSYLETGGALTAQTRGPRPYAHTLEVYQIEGNADSSVFMGGGTKYETGYAKVADTTVKATLTGGTAAQATAATWAAKSDGSFRMRLGWTEGSVDYDEMFDFTDIDFTGDAAMANVAATLQAKIRATQVPVLFSGTGVTTGVTAWQAISDGAFDIYVDGTVVNVILCNCSGIASMGDVATVLQTRWRVASSGSTETVDWDATAGRLIFKANIATPTAASMLSYLSAPSAGGGTSIAGTCDADESSSTAVLNRRGKSATTEETVTWSTDHFIFGTGTNTGNQYRMSYLEAATGNVGTDISTATWTDAASTSNLSTYVAGQTAKRTVLGLGTAWGDWSEGMKFRTDTENSADDHIIAGWYEENQLLLDVDYSGTAGYAGYVPYKLLPFDDIQNKSALGNPFDWDADDTVPMPTEDSDGITAIRRGGRNIYTFMRHHVWVVDGVDWSAPQQLTSVYGVPNPKCIVEVGDVLFFYTGEEFIALQGGRFIDLDPENRVRALLNRVSTNVAYPHGVRVKTKTAELIYWFVGLDTSFYHNVAIVYEPASGNFWLNNYKDANCSAIIRSSANVEYLLTGSQYNAAHSAPAFTFLHDEEYRNDGASTDATKTKQGLIASAGTPTTTAGYLTCATAGSVIGTWTALSTAYFALTIDDTARSVGPCDFTGDADFDAVAATIQAAIRAQTSGAETCTHDGTKFIVTSGTTTNRSNISYLRPYLPNVSDTDISGKDFMNGQSGFGTTTGAVSQIVLTLNDEGGNTAAMETGADGESGIWMYVCDSNYRNGQYVLIASNTASTATVTPNPSATPVAGWHWYAGGIVPTWTKWFDWGSPQHLQKINGVAITVAPITDDTDNVMALHGMQDLTTTVRTTQTQELGGSNDTVNTLKPKDKPSTQQGYSVMRPSSTHDFKIEDITINHSPRV